jgi:hypothetical protein
MPWHVTVPGLPLGRAVTVSPAIEPLAPPSRPTASCGLDAESVARVGMAIRVPAFVVVSAGLGLGAHAVAGGGAPSLTSALLIALLVGIAGRYFALREQSLARLVPLVWSVQAGIHFVLLSGHAHGPGAHLAAARLGGHRLHVPVVLPGQPEAIAPPQPVGLSGDLTGQAASGVASAAGLGSSALMLVMHALAGLVVAAWLRRGEAAVFRAARWIVPRLLPRRTSPIRPLALPAIPIRTAPRLHGGRLLIGLSQPRRGPPALLL